jgi:DNA modification methylase
MASIILTGDCRDSLKFLPDNSVHAVCTSPPYFNLRSYLSNEHPDKRKEIGREKTPETYVSEMVSIFRDMRRVLRGDGTFWLVIGDSYVQTPAPGLKEKDLIGIPWMMAFALRADGWYLRSALPWVKRSAMPESVTDRPTNAMEYVFLLTKSSRYFWDPEAIRQPGAIPAGTRAAKGSNVRSELKDVNGRPPEYWEYTGTRLFRNTDLFYESLDPSHGLILDGNGDPFALDVNTKGYPDAHFAVYPEKLVTPLIKSATSEYGCCPSCGAPWVRVMEKRRENRSNAARAGTQIVGKGHPSSQVRDTHDVRNGPCVATKTIGWKPSCACYLQTPVPCTILDPFGGAGTTGVVANRLGRDAILLELNDEYAALAQQRMDKDLEPKGKPRHRSAGGL